MRAAPTPNQRLLRGLRAARGHPRVLILHVLCSFPSARGARRGGTGRRSSGQAEAGRQGERSPLLLHLHVCRHPGHGRVRERAQAHRSHQPLPGRPSDAAGHAPDRHELDPPGRDHRLPGHPVPRAARPALLPTTRRGGRQEHPAVSPRPGRHSSRPGRCLPANEDSVCTHGLVGPGSGCLCHALRDLLEAGCCWVPERAGSSEGALHRCGRLWRTAAARINPRDPLGVAEGPR
mmetsp:Transcript_22108/g.50527  ORF Transcript_22108/g.50527 Transcript_22108/m.50527 type:complete len:234 (-) Transcript_22108:256-957(-)